MRLRKSTCALLLGGGLSVFNIGCAAVDAIVSSPAGHAARNGSPQRIAAIGRVFENQGRYAQARSMYRQALKNDPNNSVARDRLEYLATIQPAANRRTATEEAIAIADTLAPPKVQRSTASPQPFVVDSVNHNRASNQSAIQMVRAFESPSKVEAASLSEDRPFGKASSSHSMVADNTLEFAEHPEVVEVQETEAVQFVETDGLPELTGLESSSHLAAHAPETVEEGHWADSVGEQIPIVSRQDALESVEPVEATATVETVEFAVLQTEKTQEQSIEFDDTELVSWDKVDNVGFWRPTRASVSLSDVLQWGEAPEQHSQQLITAINLGKDAGVQALSVALLGEIDMPDADTITALRQAANTSAPLVKAAALDALVIQGKNDSESLDGLVSLLAGDDPKIRTQAAATLRRMADTEWRDDAINSLHRLLDDENDEVVAVAATSLSDFGAAAVPCRERLIQIAATTSNEMVLEATSVALSRIPRAEP